ncbi:MAG: DnaJ domain-containing protein [Desulfobulbaceae bacterium]|nr:DnaJ domain-containing protein [Desulfobulbaceae bacterium]
MATHTRNFNIWKMGLLAFVAAPIVMNLNDSKAAIWIAVIFFFAGFMLPHAHIFNGFFNAISEVINGIRFKDERRHIESQKEELRRKAEELRRREAELERLRREYEEAMHRARHSNHRPGGERRQDKQQSSDKERPGRGAGTNSSSNNWRKTNNPQRAAHLETLGLDPNKVYSSKEIRKLFRENVSKCHPDRHQDKTEEEIRRLTEKLQKIIAAADWLKRNPDE